MNGREFAEPRLELAKGMHLDRTLNACGAPEVTVSAGFEFLNSKVSEDKLNDLYVWLGRTIAWIRHNRKK